MYVCMYVSIYLSMYLCIYVCMYMCAYICVGLASFPGPFTSFEILVIGHMKLRLGKTVLFGLEEGAGRQWLVTQEAEASPLVWLLRFIYSLVCFDNKAN